MNDIAILVNSCDAYSDLWPFFFRLLKKNWENIESHNIYLNTETVSKYDAGLPITIINTRQEGADQWGKRVINCLNHIKENYVVLLMDDFFLRSALDDRQLQLCLDYFEKEPKSAVFYLTHVFKKTFPESVFEKFEQIPQYTNYRLNSGPSLWKKDKLIKYIEETDNPWAWEYFGTCRTNHTDDEFFCIKRENTIYDYAHAIYRGRWLENEVKPLMDEFGLDIDLTKRGSIAETDAPPKRNIKWKISFLMTGIKMVGFDAIGEVFRDWKNANSSE